MEGGGERSVEGEPMFFFLWAISCQVDMFLCKLRLQNVAGGMFWFK